MFCLFFYVFFFKQKTAYEMRISDWSSDVCSSDLLQTILGNGGIGRHGFEETDVLLSKVIGPAPPKAKRPDQPLADEKRPAYERVQADAFEQRDLRVDRGLDCRYVHPHGPTSPLGARCWTRETFGTDGLP